MITHEKIDEWIKEVEERPSSAPNIIRYIARRLSDLTNRNEELLNENIALRLGKKTDEYESRIANLEYQLDILQRQISSGAALPSPAEAATSVSTSASLLIFNGFGQVLRVEVDPQSLVETRHLAKLVSEVRVEGLTPRLLATSTQEELLFVFDSGRAVTAPVTAIPAASPEELDWEQAFLQEPRGSEELVTICAMAKMTLADLCIQTSRRGFVKKMSEAFFETCVNSSFVGTGTKQKFDKTCSLIFTGKNDLYVLVSKEGRAFAMEANKLPITIEPVFLISATDHIVNTFMVRKKPYLLFVTNQGKAVYRDIQWIEQANTFRTHGQLLFSKNRRDTGTWIVGAAAVDEKDWGVALMEDGRLELHKVSDLFETGSLGISGIVDFVIYGTERWY